MVAMKGSIFIECSTDGVVLLDIAFFQEWESVTVFTQFPDRHFAFESLEIKTKVASTNLGIFVQLSAPDTVRCELSDEAFTK